MEKYIDIHSHILPGVDDGSASMEESIAMLRMAEKEHIRKMILTPHQKPDRKCVSVKGTKERIEQLRQAAKEHSIDIELYPGSELLYYRGLPETLEAGKVCTLAGSHYVLVEFLPNESWPYIRDGMYSLLCGGYWPIAAHVERYEQVVKDFGRVEELADMGCYIQVNAGSIMGDYGFSMKWVSRRLVKEGLVHFVATDAHKGSGKRMPRLLKCADWLLAKDKRYARELLYENAEHIFSDVEL